MSTLRIYVIGVVFLFAELFSGILSNLLYFVLHLENTGSFPKPLNAAAEKECIEKMKEGDANARKKLIEHNLRLVAHIIKKYYSQSGEQEDLVSIGTIGLIKAIDSFKPEKGTRLATYAARCIENEILMHFRSRRRIQSEISLNEPIDTDGEGNPLTLMDIISVDDTIADDLDFEVKKEQLYKFLSGITNRREREIVIMRYGLDGEKPLTQREIAKLLGISRSYVSRIEKKAVERLKSKYEIVG